MRRRSISLLKQIIKENILGLVEGGHGGMINVLTAPRLLNTLEDYSILRSTTPPMKESIIKFLDDISKIAASTNSLTAYVGTNDSTSEISKAYSIVNAAYNARNIMQYGEPDVKLLEFQIMNVLRASFYDDANKSPSSGFIEIFGAHIDWSYYPRPKTPAAISVSKVEKIRHTA